MKLKKIFKYLISITGGLCLCLSLTSTVKADNTASQLDTDISHTGSGSVTRLTDGSYTSKCYFDASDTITITSNQDIYGIYIIWGSEVSPYTITYDNKTVSCGKYGYLHDYVALEQGTKSVTINISSEVSICDIYAYSSGTLPSEVQVWQPPCNSETDILVFSTHADDEILFLGAVLANYGGEQKLNVQVAYLCDFFLTEPVRMQEELDGLWECGITHYPIKGDFKDLYSMSLETALNQYNYEDVVAYATECIRRFKPMVCVSQDFNGEYGHGGHRIFAKAIAESVENSNTVEFYSESSAKYGIWNVPKTYMHLYEENTIKLDVDTPLSNLGGRTTVKVLQDAFAHHATQAGYTFKVRDDGYSTYNEKKFDCRAFGLYRSTVGTDTNNNMMDNVKSYSQQKAEALAKAEAEEQASREATLAENNSDMNENNDSSHTSGKLSAKKMIINIIAIIIIVIVIALQASRSKSLYRKKYKKYKGQWKRQ
ncbi:MAG: PIG-L family deacetylase [Eubacteriales bacterium]|nr:PIG-L family deacetylase [Eubacteriales bacterium]